MTKFGLPIVAPITDPNAGPTPNSTSLAPRSDNGGVRKSPSGLAALAGSVVKGLSGSAGTGLLGGLISSGLQMIGDKKNFERQKELYSMQRADALADYQMQREDYLSDLADERAYNSPEAQRARLEAAGINPNTVFGSGSVVNTTSEAQNNAGMRGSAAPAPSSSGLGSTFAQGFIGASSGNIQSSQMQVNAELARSNIELQKAQMLKMLSETRGIDASTKRQAIENGWLDFMFESELNERYQKISESLSRQNSMAVSDAVNLFELNNILPAQQRQILAATNKLYREIDLLVSEYELFKDTRDFRINSAMYDSWNKRYEAEISRFERDIKSIQVDISKYDRNLKATQAPMDSLDNWMYGLIHRFGLVRKAIISFDK